MKMKQYFLSGAMALAGLFASCSRTETEEPANVPQKGNEVTVTVAPSTDFTQSRTRAESGGEQLRYIAELWEEDKTINPQKPTPKKLIERTEQVGADANKFTFTVEQQGDYVILFWADYIAAGAQTSEKKIDRTTGDNTFSVTFQGYEDKYFYTGFSKSTGEGLQDVMMKTIATSPNDFYNRTLEAFCGKVSFEKGTDIVNKQITLKRPLCKYIFKEKADDLSGISNTNIKLIYFYRSHNVYTGEAPVGATSYDKYETGRAVNILNSSEKELFSFYCFGGKSEGTLAGITTTSMIFNFTASGGSGKKYKDIQIPLTNIPCRANYIYTISGSFVQEDFTGTAVNVDVTCDGEGWMNDGKDLDN